MKSAGVQTLIIKWNWHNGSYFWYGKREVSLCQSQPIMAYQWCEIQLHTLLISALDECSQPLHWWLYPWGNSPSTHLALWTGMNILPRFLPAILPHQSNPYCMNECVRLGHNNPALAPWPSLIYSASPFHEPFINPTLQMKYTTLFNWGVKIVTWFHKELAQVTKS
jgi:hypothetical protein